MRNLLVATAMIAAPVAAFAQAPASTEVPLSPDALANARELVSLMHLDQVMVASLNAQADVEAKGLADRIRQSGLVPPNLAKDPELGAILKRDLDAMQLKMLAGTKAVIPQIIERATQVYARIFTAAQLRDLIAFYRSPIGRTFLAKMPELSADVSAITHDLTTGPILDAIKEIMPQMTAELEAWSAKHKQSQGNKQ